MATDLIMPKLGLTMDEGTVIEWLVAEGDRVEEEQPALQVETDKVVVQVEANASGIMGPLLYEAGQTVPVTTVLARIYQPGEEIPAADSPNQIADKPEAPQIARQYSSPAAPAASAVRPGDHIPPVRRNRVFSSPRARKRARELGVDWQQLAGRGPRGRVVEQDVEDAGQSGTIPDQADVQWEAPSSIQRVTAERMVSSFGSAPHFYLAAEVEATALLDLRERLLPRVEQRTGVRLTVTDLLVKIVGAALADYPAVNAVWDAGRIGLNRQVNINLAITTESGLVAPVLRQVTAKSLSQLAAERADLVEKARAGTLDIADQSSGGFTLSNLGMYRVDAFQAILNPPQAAILAVGRIAERPVAIDGQLAVHPTVILSLSCDHRVLDGAIAAPFLEQVVSLIEDPYQLLV